MPVSESQDVAEVRDVRYLDDGHDARLPSTSLFHCSPGKGKKWRSSASVILKKKKFSVASPASAHTTFEAALDKSIAELGARRSGRDRRNAPVFQGDTINNLFVFVIIDFSHL